MAVHPVRLHVEAGGGVGPAERLLGALGRPHVDEDLAELLVQDGGDGRVGRHAAVDGALLERGDEGRARSDGDRCELADLHAVLDGEVLRQEVGGRTEAGDAELLALEVLGRGDVARPPCWRRSPPRRARARTARRTRRLALGLEVERVVVEADGALDLPGDERGLGLDTGRLAEELDVETLVLEVAEPLGEHRRQVDDLVEAADHDLDCSPLPPPPLSPEAAVGARRVVGAGGERGEGEQSGGGQGGAIWRCMRMWFTSL